MSARRATTGSAIDLEREIVKSGYLVKRAVESGANWRSRFFILTANTLTYYRTHKHLVNARGDFLLTQNTRVLRYADAGDVTAGAGGGASAEEPIVADSVPEERRRKWGFTLKSPFMELTMCAASDEDYREWTLALTAVIRDIAESTRGYLHMKRGNFALWVRKFFVLHKSVLTYHADHRATKKIQGMIDMEKMGVVERAGKQIILVDRDNSKHRIPMRAADEAAADGWEQAFRNTISAAERTRGRSFSADKPYHTERVLLNGFLSMQQMDPHDVYQSALQAETAPGLQILEPEWIERYIILTPHVLYEFEDAHSVSAISKVRISANTVIYETTNEPYSFEIITPNRVLQFRSIGPDEVAAWLKAVREAVQINFEHDHGDNLLDTARKLPEEIYTITFRERKALGVVLERSAEWALVRVCDEEATGIIPASALLAINGERVLLEPYQNTIGRIAGWTPPLSLSFLAPPARHGWLTKLSRGRRRKRKNWRLRYFVLSRGSLYYYKNNTVDALQTPLGEVELMGSAVSLVSQEITRVPFCFQIMSGVTRLVMKGVTIEDMMAWAATLYRAIAIANGGGFLLEEEKRLEATRNADRQMREGLQIASRELDDRNAEQVGAERELEEAEKKLSAARTGMRYCDAALKRLKEELAKNTTDGMRQIVVEAEYASQFRKGKYEGVREERDSARRKLQQIKRELLNAKKKMSDAAVSLAETEYTREQEEQERVHEQQEHEVTRMHQTQAAVAAADVMLDQEKNKPKKTRLLRDLRGSVVLYLQGFSSDEARSDRSSSTAGTAACSSTSSTSNNATTTEPGASDPARGRFANMFGRQDSKPALVSVSSEQRAEHRQQQQQQQQEQQQRAQAALNAEIPSTADTLPPDIDIPSAPPRASIGEFQTATTGAADGEGEKSGPTSRPGGRRARRPSIHDVVVSPKDLLHVVCEKGRHQRAKSFGAETTVRPSNTGTVDTKDAATTGYMSERPGKVGARSGIRRSSAPDATQAHLRKLGDTIHGRPVLLQDDEVALLLSRTGVERSPTGRPRSVKRGARQGPPATGTTSTAGTADTEGGSAMSPLQLAPANGGPPASAAVAARSSETSISPMLRAKCVHNAYRGLANDDDDDDENDDVEDEDDYDEDEDDESADETRDGFGDLTKTPAMLANTAPHRSVPAADERSSEAEGWQDCNSVHGKRASDVEYERALEETKALGVTLTAGRSAVGARVGRAGPTGVSKRWSRSPSATDVTSNGAGAAAVPRRESVISPTIRSALVEVSDHLLTKLLSKQRQAMEMGAQAAGDTSMTTATAIPANGGGSGAMEQGVRPSLGAGLAMEHYRPSGGSLAPTFEAGLADRSSTPNPHPESPMRDSFDSVDLDGASSNKAPQQHLTDDEDDMRSSTSSISSASGSKPLSLVPPPPPIDSEGGSAAAAMLSDGMVPEQDQELAAAMAAVAAAVSEAREAPPEEQVIPTRSTAPAPSSFVKEPLSPVLDHEADGDGDGDGEGEGAGGADGAGATVARQGPLVRSQSFAVRPLPPPPGGGYALVTGRRTKRAASERIAPRVIRPLVSPPPTQQVAIVSSADGSATGGAEMQQGEAEQEPLQRLRKDAKALRPGRSQQALRLAKASHGGFARSLGAPLGTTMVGQEPAPMDGTSTLPTTRGALLPRGLGAMRRMQSERTVSSSRSGFGSAAAFGDGAEGGDGGGGGGGLRGAGRLGPDGRPLRHRGSLVDLNSPDTMSPHRLGSDDFQQLLKEENVPEAMREQIKNLVESSEMYMF